MKKSAVRNPQPAAGRRGTILIVVLWISTALVSTTLMFGHSMLMEYRAAQNTLAGMESLQAVDGARRYVGYVLKNAEEPGRPPDVKTYSVEDVAVGDARFWLIGRGTTEQFEDDRPVFGLVDECSKLNLNTATREMLELLPNMTAEIAAAIIDWRDSDEELTPDGAEQQQYLLQTPKYNCKNAPFETDEELRLLYNADLLALYGEDANQNGILDPNENDGDASPPEDNADGELDPGLVEYLTVWSAAPTTGGAESLVDIGGDEQALTDLLNEHLGETRAQELLSSVTTSRTSMRSILEFYVRTGMTLEEFALVADSLRTSDTTTTRCVVNVNTASAAVLACIPGIGKEFADALVTYREGKTDELETVGWVTQVLDEESAVQAGPYLVARSYRYSADIAAVGSGGRGFRRVYYVMDVSGEVPVVLYRRDRSRLGWPLGPAIRREIGSTSSQERFYR